MPTKAAAVPVDIGELAPQDPCCEKQGPGDELLAAAEAEEVFSLELPCCYGACGGGSTYLQDPALFLTALPRVAATWC